MKPKNNKEQQKIIIVGALFVAMLAVLGYNLFGTQGSAAPAPPPAPGTPGVAGAVTPGGAPAPGAVPGAPVRPYIDFKTIPLVTSGRDPFVPTGAGALPPSPTPPPPANPNAYLNTHGMAPGGELNKGLQPAPGSLSDVVMGGRPGSPAPEAVAPVQLPPPAPPAYVVTGVVLGDKGGRDVAILRGSGAAGQEDRKFVTVGEDIGNGFYVASIHADGIILKSRLNATQSPVNISLGKSE